MREQFVPYPEKKGGRELRQIHRQEKRKKEERIARAVYRIEKRSPFTGDLEGVLDTEMIPTSIDESDKQKILSVLEKKRAALQKDDPYSSYFIKLDRVE